MKIIASKSIEDAKKHRRNNFLNGNFSKIKNEKAITLLALVITIIILLILAGVGIHTLTNTALLKKSKEAKEKYLNSEGQENKILSEYMSMISSRNNKDYDEKIYDQWTTWLYLAGIDNPEKYNKGKILENEELMRTLLSSESAVDYMLQSTDFIMQAIFNSKTALGLIIQNQNVMNKVILNNEWTSEIENNKIAIETLKKDSNFTTVPTLTGNSSNVVQSSSYNDSDFWGAWKCFDGKIGVGDSAAHWSSRDASEQYVGYKFDNPVWIFEVTLNNGVADTVEYGAKKAEVQYSDNNIDYYSASDILNIEKKNESQTLQLNGNIGKHCYWRIHILEGYNNSYMNISEIKFNGLK